MKKLLAMLLVLALALGALALAEDAEPVQAEPVQAEELTAESVEAGEPGEAEELAAADLWAGDAEQEELAEPNTAELPNFKYDGSRYATFTAVDGATEYAILNDFPGGGSRRLEDNDFATLTGNTWKVDIKGYMDRVAVGTTGLGSGSYVVTIRAKQGSYYTLAESSVSYNYTCDLTRLETPKIWFEGTTVNWTIPEHSNYFYFWVNIYNPDGVLVDDNTGFNGLPGSTSRDISTLTTIYPLYRYQAVIHFLSDKYLSSEEAKTLVYTGEQLQNMGKQLTGEIKKLYTGSGKFNVNDVVGYEAELLGASASIPPASQRRNWQTSADGKTWTDTGHTAKTYLIEEADAGKYLRLVLTAKDYEGQIVSPYYKVGSGTVKYEIIVNGGKANVDSATAGETVTITADDRSAQYMTFSYWFYTEGTVVENYKSATTTFVMPDHDVTFVAQYDVEYQEELFVTVPEPGIGEKPGVPTVATDEYSIEKYRWLDVSTDAVLGEDAVFEADKYYQLQVDLKCKRFVAQHPIYAVNGVCDEYIRLSRTGNKAKIIATFIPVEKPAPTTLKKVKKGKKKLTVVWKKQAKGTNGYVVQYATKEDFSDAQEKYVKKPKTTKLTIKKLKAKTKYYVRVCTYRLDEAKMVRSDWSNVKSAKTR